MTNSSLNMPALTHVRCFGWTAASDATLFKTEQGNKTVTDLVDDVSRALAKIDQYFVGTSSTSNSDGVILYHTDSYQFTVRLLALALAGKHVVLPANGQPETLNALLRQYPAYFGQAPVPLVPELAPELIPTANNIEDCNVGENFKRHQQLTWPQDGELIFFTSGSTGDAKKIVKNWRQINLELTQLQSHFGLTTDSKVYAGVSHQHIYGLLFRVLWPLQQGCFIDFNTYKYPEHLAASLANQAQVVFISSPAQLSRLIDDNVVAKANCQLELVVSSGGPLPDQDAITLYQQFNLAVTQVYGSTETGGIATRQLRRPGAQPWQPFSGISVDIDRASECLLLTSPYLDNQTVLLDDRISLGDNGDFTLLGRADRTIKLEEKRLDLDAMEHLLISHPFVKQARAQVIAKHRQTLCVAMVLTAAGDDALINLGKRALNAQFKQYLLRHFERVCLPRKWRYIKQLPYNQQGKLLYKELENIFE